MPLIRNLNLRRVEGRTIEVEFTVLWRRFEQVVPYVARVVVYEQDSGLRGRDDFLEVFDNVDVFASTDRPAEQTQTLTVTGRTSWNTERGNEEIYVRLSLFPNRDLTEVPGSASRQTNVISGNF